MKTSYTTSVKFTPAYSLWKAFLETNISTIQPNENNSNLKIEKIKYLSILKEALFLDIKITSS